MVESAQISPALCPSSRSVYLPQERCKQIILHVCLSSCTYHDRMKHRAACVHSFCQKGAPHRSYLSAAVKCRADNKSSFADTSLSSRVSKGLVSGLTALVNNVAGNQPASQVPDLVQRPAKLARSPEEILDGTKYASSVLVAHQPSPLCRL